MFQMTSERFELTFKGTKTFKIGFRPQGPGRACITPLAL